MSPTAKDVALSVEIDASARVREYATKGLAARATELLPQLLDMVAVAMVLSGRNGHSPNGTTPAKAKAPAVTQAVTAARKAATAPASRKRRKMSAAARKRISEAQKARWAREKAKTQPTARRR